MAYKKIVLEIIVPDDEVRVVSHLMQKSYMADAGIYPLKSGEVEELTEEDQEELDEFLKTL